MRFGIAALFAALLVTLVSIPTADAQCHGVRSGGFSQSAYTPYVTSPYVAPTYNAPVSAPYTAPYVGHGHDYDSFHVEPFAVPVAIVPSTFYSVLPELAYARVNQEIALAAADLAAKKVGAEILQRLTAPPQGPPPGPPQGGPQGPIGGSIGGPPPSGETSRLSGPKEAMTDSAFRSMTQSRCVKCHGRGADFDLTQPDGLTLEQRLEVVRRLKTTDPKLRMPKDGPRVSDADLDLALNFVLAAR